MGWSLRRIGAWLCAASLLASAACDSQDGKLATFDCTEGGLSCPDNAPICQKFAGSSLCRSSDESACVALDPALRGSSVRAADLDADGLSDLVFLDGRSLTSALGVSAGGFASPVALEANVDSFELAELTGDSAVDLLLLQANKLWLMPGVGDGSFDAQAVRLLFDDVEAVVGIVDLDADSASDVLVSDEKEKLTALSSANDFAPLPLPLVTPPRPIRVLAGDLDADGAVELLVEGAQAQTGIYHFEVDFWNQTATLLGSPVLLADLDADGRLDLVVNETSGLSVSVRLGQRSGGFEASASFDGAAFLAADLNADGNLDLLLNRALQGQMLRLDGHGDGTFSEAAPMDIRDNPESAEAIYTGSETSVVFSGDIGFVSQLKASCLARP